MHNADIRRVLFFVLYKSVFNDIDRNFFQEKSRHTFPALFDAAVTGLDVAAGIVADEVKFGASCFWTTVNRVRCSSLSIAGGALVVPANVSGAIVPGARLFYGYASALFPADHVDSYGNAYYENESHTSLSFGRQGGLVIIAR